MTKSIEGLEKYGYTGTRACMYNTNSIRYCTLVKSKFKQQCSDDRIYKDG